MDGRVTRRCLKLLFGGSMMSSEIAIVTYDTSDVPSEVLVRLLVGTQQLVLLLGAAQEYRTLVERNLTVDPSHACSLRAGAALLPYPPTCCRLCRSFRL